VRLEHETAPEHSTIEAATGVMNPRLKLYDYRAYLERTMLDQTVDDGGRRGRRGLVFASGGEGAN
jgi:hypothetical protein